MTSLSLGRCCHEATKVQTGRGGAAGLAGLGSLLLLFHRMIVSIDRLGQRLLRRGVCRQRCKEVHDIRKEREWCDLSMRKLPLKLRDRPRRVECPRCGYGWKISRGRSPGRASRPRPKPPASPGPSARWPTPARLSLLHRCETRLHLMSQRAFRNLLCMRNSPVQNGPKKSPVINETNFSI